MPKRTMTVDGNEAAAAVAHRVSDVIAIYSITPALPPGVMADDEASAAAPNDEE